MLAAWMKKMQTAKAKFISQFQTEMFCFNIFKCPKFWRKFYLEGHANPAEFL